MSYAAWSVVFGEQPSAAKWNIIGTNMAGFNDGSAIGTNAIKLGSAQITTPFTTTTVGSYVDVTSLTSTVAVPAGGRDVEITVSGGNVGSTAIATTAVAVVIRESSTVLGGWLLNVITSGLGLNTSASALVSAPSAGSHTYKVSIYQSAAGTLSMNAGSANPAGGSFGPVTLLVKAI